MTPAVHAIAQLTALRAIDSLIEGTVIGVFAAVVLRATRRSNAGVRFAVSFSALLAIAILPFLNGLLPGAMPQIASPSANSAAITVSDSWALYFFAAWAVIAGLLLMRLGRSMWHLRALRRSCEPVDVRSLDPLLQQTLHRHANGRKIDFCISDKVRVPTALGLLEPAVVVPRWVMRELTPTEMNQVLLHELAHLRRRDDWTTLAQQLVRALFFFHPAVWWIETRVALEREMACDDAVLAETSSPRAYAECLAHLAEKSFVRRSLALAQAMLGRVHQTSVRVAEILNPQRPDSARHNWKPAAALIAGFAVVCAVGVERAPHLIAFQDAAIPHPTAHGITPAQFGSVPLATASGYQIAVAPIVPAKLNTDAPRHHRKPAIARISRPRTANLVHLAKAKAVPVPMVETMFVVIETQGVTASGDVVAIPRVYHIQMWHLLLLHPAVDPDVKPPQKQT